MHPPKMQPRSHEDTKNARRMYLRLSSWFRVFVAKNVATTRMLSFVWSNSHPFPVLFHEFFAQFFASESATSDHHVRQAIIGVLAFLITPGFLFPLQLSGAFEFAAIRFPAMLDPLIRLVTTIFITYGIVSIGVIAAFTWDSLGFDRRDAMVLGPTPVGGATIVTAKLAALAALLLAGAAMVNVTAGFSFALLASNHAGVTSVVCYFIAHMAATMSAATFVFCLLV